MLEKIPVEDSAELESLLCQLLYAVPGGHRPTQPAVYVVVNPRSRARAVRTPTAQQTNARLQEAIEHDNMSVFHA